MDQRELADSAVAWLTQLGAQPPPGSRFDRALRALHSLPLGERLADRDDRTTQTQIHTTQDLLEIEFIRTSRLVEDSDTPTQRCLVDRLRQATRDADVPNADRSPGRDAQKELFAAAAFHYAGFRPVTLAEPDIVCHWGNSPLSIAVKNARGRGNFDRLMSRACDQVRASKREGVVWCDIARLISAPGDLYRPIADGIPADAHQREEVRQFLREHVQRLTSHANTKSVLLFVFMSSRIVLDAGVLRLESYRLHVDVPRNDIYAQHRSALLQQAMSRMFITIKPERWTADGQLAAMTPLEWPSKLALDRIDY